MDTGRTVIYIDAAGVTHEALVFAVNALNPEILDLVYVDQTAPAVDNIRKVFAIEHHERKVESNPSLPTYALNAWKEYYEEHGIIPPDHPNFDHPFKHPDLGLNGQPIPVVRPITEAFEKAHQEFTAASAATFPKEDSDELKALSGSGGLAGGLTGPGNLPSGVGTTPVPFGEGPAGKQVVVNVDPNKGEITLEAVPDPVVQQEGLNSDSDPAVPPPDNATNLE